MKYFTIQIDILFGNSGGTQVEEVGYPGRCFSGLVWDVVILLHRDGCTCQST